MSPFSKLLESSLHAVQQQIIKIHNLNQLIASIMLDDSQRSLLRRPAGDEQRVQRRRQRADVVSSRIRNVADLIHSNRAQSA